MHIPEKNTALHQQQLHDNKASSITFFIQSL
jgi:hypothetical protein